MCGVYSTFNQFTDRHRANQQFGFSIRDADSGTSFIFDCVQDVKYLFRTLFQQEASFKARGSGVIFGGISCNGHA